MSTNWISADMIVGKLIGGGRNGGGGGSRGGGDGIVVLALVN